MVYLKNTPLEECLDSYKKEFSKLIEIDKIEPEDSLGRVCADNVYATRSVPHYVSSAMDGYAVKAEETVGANVDKPVELKFDKQAVYVDTGDAVPDGFDAVIKIEDVNKLQDGIEIIGAAFKGQHIRPIGEDIVAHELLLPKGKTIEPMDVAVMVASGTKKVLVTSEIKVAIIPTGDEIVSHKNNPQIGEIVDSNSHLFAALLKKWGANPVVYPIVKDDFKALKETVKDAAAKCHMVLLNAGSSAGKDDYSSEVINTLGEVYYHGVAIKPGKPTILGKAFDKPIIGVPGYPVSGFIVMEKIIKEIYHSLMEITSVPSITLKARLTKPAVSDLKHKEFIRVKVGKVKGKVVATPLGRGSALMNTIVHGDGLLTVPSNSEGHRAGEDVEIELFKQLDLEKTIMAVGSHDLCLDLIAKGVTPKYSLNSAHVGSLGGIMAIKKGQAHMAGVHLLDPESGKYNIPYIKRYISDEKVYLLSLAKRTQGIMVQKGNPLNIKQIGDLTKISIANRQKGAGTRVLLDYLLYQNGISPKEISGYNKEYFTHLDVAAQVKSGRVQAGMGIYAASKAMEIDFVPVFEESYDLLITEEFYKSEGFKVLHSVITSTSFKQEVNKLGGYNLKDCGNIISIEGSKKK
ncbi:molybdopterin biosynthesis protein [Proteinivorax tanatarense]|uniref:Molybdopterin molybdenumtransferase n=1 Tax=Proteinivorax tanatarense TaxID=1260629 RepID=A0AAU7VKM1_9FIRM